ncbi:T9SS type A sorting domain-containing protein [candidate division WOR-3 bacterium]|nr:T9SS type A sorting domain-containing protein [candidate division WOR-3 bacterium]
MRTILISSIVLFSASSTFPTPIVVSGGNQNDIIGRFLRIDNGTLLAVIERNPDWNSGDFYSSLSTDNGLTWGSLSPVIVSAGNQSTFSLTKGNSDTILLFYASDESGVYRIYSAFSLNGTTWSNSGQVDLGWSSSQNVYDPSVERENDGSLTMTYISMGFGAYIAHRPSGGQWDHDKILLQTGAYRVRVCKSAAGTYMASYHRRTGTTYQYDVFVRTSSDRLNWSQETQLTTNQNSHDPFCSITPDGSFMVDYAKNVSGVYNIHSRISSDGVNWEPEVQITNDMTFNTQPCLFVENDTIYRMWTHAIDYNTDNDIYFEKFIYTPNSVEQDTALVLEFLDFNAVQQGNCILLEIRSIDEIFLSLSVFDFTGRKVLHDAVLATQGASEKTIDASSLSSGVYYIALKTRGFIRAEKFFYIKM